MTGPVPPMFSQRNNTETGRFPILEDIAKGKASSIPVKPKEPSKCPLFCCFYSEFDIKKGPVVRFQSPKGFMNQDISISVEKIHGLLKTTFSELMAESSIPGVSPSNSDSTNESSAVAEDPPSEEHQTRHKHGTGASDPPIVEIESSDENSYAPTGLSIFDSTSEYIITGSELTSKIVTLSTHAWHVMTRPTMISDARYERNALFFSVGLVLRRAADPRPFRPIISKLALTLEAMERESGYLTKPTHRPRIQTVLEQVLMSLNSAEWECNVLLSPSNALHLKLYHPPKPETSPVHDHEVPILLRRDLQLQMYDWDLAINWVILHIDGATNARQISLKAEVDLEMVLACLRVLKHHGVIALVSQFNYSNRYEFTPRATAMLAGKEPKLLQEALEFCWKSRRIFSSGGSGGGETQNGAQKQSTLSPAGSSSVPPSNYQTNGTASSPHQLSHPSHMAVIERGFSAGGFSSTGSDSSPQPQHSSQHMHDPASPPYHPAHSGQMGHRIQQQPPRQHLLPPPILSLTPSSSYPPRTMGLLGGSHQSSNFRLAMMAQSGSMGVYPSSLEGTSATGTGIGVTGLKNHEDHRLWKSALAELYCACTRSLSFGDLWMALSVELPPTALAVPNLSLQVPAGSNNGNRIQKSLANSTATNPRYRQSRYPSKGPNYDDNRLDGTEPAPLSSIMGSISLSPSETLHLENLRGGRAAHLTRETSGNISRTSSMSGGPTVDWKDFFNRIDHRRFLTFGLAHGLLTRIHSYPCFPYLFPETPPPGVGSAPPTLASGTTLTSVTSDSGDSTNEAHLIPPPGGGVTSGSRKPSFSGTQKVPDSLGGSGGVYSNVTNASFPPIASRSNKSYQLAKSVAESMDGTRCDDALSCFFEKPYPQLVELVERYAAQPDHKVISFFATAPTV